ncbi:MAG: branched-chain amino acid ABC transporter permease, partial [Chloroflexota bacterium]|nr:branched-chain amino acid ABC transporter permease [Chloroflexota bacterium]
MVSGNILAQAILQGVMIGAVYGLICLGLNMLFAVTGLLNFAHGNFLALAMYICLSLYTSFQLDPYLSMLITIPIFFGLGYLLFKFLFKKVLNVHILMGVQLSLGLLFVIESSLLLVYGADYQSVPSFLGTTVLRVGELSISAPFIVAFVVAIIIAIVLFRILGTTRLGRSIRAIVQNREAATL